MAYSLSSEKSTVLLYQLQCSVAENEPLHGHAGQARLKLGKSLDIMSTSLLHQHGVSGGWGGGALLMATSDRSPSPASHPTKMEEPQPAVSP